MQHKEFIFESYRCDYDRAGATLLLCYRYDGGPRFEERLIFDFAPQRLAPAAREVLDRIFRLIFLMSGVSYYKAFVPETLICESFPLDRTTGEFLQKFYERGLAEFAFKNRVSLRDHFAIGFSDQRPAAP